MQSRLKSILSHLSFSTSQYLANKVTPRSAHSDRLNSAIFVNLSVSLWHKWGGYVQSSPPCGDALGQKFGIYENVAAIFA